MQKYMYYCMHLNSANHGIQDLIIKEKKANDK